MTETPRRVLVLDANILIRAVLGPRVRNIILDNARRADFFTPLVCVEDARRHLPDILRSKGVDPESAMAVLERLLEYVQPLDQPWIEEYAAIARARMRHRDPDDWPVLAAAMALSCPIWTQDADFFGVGIATWTTEHVAEYFEG
jgi:predicted nucleic acid-binding protein